MSGVPCLLVAMTLSAVFGQDRPRSGAAERVAVENALSELLDAAESAELAVRRAEAARTRALVRAVDYTETAVAAAIGLEFAHRNLVAEVAVAYRAGERAAAHMVNVAGIARRLAATVDALEAGRVSYRHLAVIADEPGTLPAGAVGAFEAAVLPFAEAHTPAQTARRARVLRERLHPESIRVRSARALEDRGFWVSPLADGMAQVGAILPAVEAMAIDNRVTRIATALRTGPGERRTLAQLQADAFADLLLGADAHTAGATGRSAATRRAAGRIRPQVQVTVPLMSMVHLSEDPAELIGYGPIDSAAALELAARAPLLRRLITDPFTGAPVATDPNSYRLDTATRHWIRARDRHCRFPGCQRRAEATDIDHTTGWADGGRSSPGNLALLCRHHHRLKDTGGWRASQDDRAQLHWTSPAGRTYTTRPEHPDQDDTAARLWQTQAHRAYDPEPADVTD